MGERERESEMKDHRNISTLGGEVEVEKKI